MGLFFFTVTAALHVTQQALICARSGEVVWCLSTFPLTGQRRIKKYTSLGPDSELLQVRVSHFGGLDRLAKDAVHLILVVMGSIL